MKKDHLLLKLILINIKGKGKKRFMQYFIKCRNVYQVYINA